jgi:transcriptional regulator with XRE-family HTH domain
VISLEILSTGEKIKRARIYKGLTLKDICEDKISVSKMSCIENNKVVPEEWILAYISEKLSLDINYLNHGVKEQIEENIKAFLTKTNHITFIEEVVYNLDYAESYEYYDLACKLLHILFEFYLEKGKYEELSVIIPRYYHLCQKSKDDMLMVNYYMDIAKYLFNNKEFNQACSYYTTVRKTLKEKNLKKAVQYVKATYNECASYIMVADYEKAYKMSQELEEIILLTDDEIIKAEVYQLLAMLFISLKLDKFYDYKEKSIKCFGDNLERKCRAIHNFAVTMFNNKLIDIGIAYIKEAVAEFPKDNKERLCDFLKLIIATLIENNELDLAQIHCDDMLNLAINLDNLSYIERAYYFKSTILQKQNNLFLAETYMNLSLDALVKFGTRSQIHKRYLEMGNMYHKLGEVRESIKFLNLALQLEKKI